MPKLSKSEKLKHCAGCYNNYYNGNNTIGVSECWLLKTARLISRKKVSINQAPPWTQAPGKYLSCYRETGYVLVEPKATH